MTERASDSVTGRGGRFRLVAVISAVTLASCAGGNTSHQSHATAVPTSNRYHVCDEPDCHAYNVLPVVVRRVRYGFSCSGNVPPGTTPNPAAPPIEYDARDVGRPGFPSLTRGEKRTLRRIEATGSSKTLKIAWVMSDEKFGQKFIVFDDPDAPCTAGPVKVINGACNEFYEPSENPYHTMPAPECLPFPRKKHDPKAR